MTPETDIWAQKAFEDFGYPIDKFLSNGHGTPKLRYEILHKDVSCIDMAISWNRVELFKLLLNDHRLKINEYANYSFLTVMCANDLIEMLKIYAEHPSYDPSAGNNDGLYAASHGNPQCLKFLLEDSRVDPTDQQHRALIYATCHNRIECVELIVAAYFQRNIPFPPNLIKTLKDIANGGDYRYDPEIYGSMPLKVHEGSRKPELITLFGQTF